MTDDAYERGMKVRREVLGDAHVDAAIARTTDFTADFQDYITRYAWGEIWARPGLDRRMRSAITLTALVALRREDELAMHVRAALRNGLSADEIKEILLHAAIYCGVPAANGAFAIAQARPRGGRRRVTRAVLLAAVRTPIGRHGGALSLVRPDDLAAVAMRPRSSAPASTRPRSRMSTSAARTRPERTTATSRAWARC